MFPFVGWFWIDFFWGTQPPSDTKTCQGIQKNLRFQPVKVSVEVISRSSYSGLKIRAEKLQKNAVLHPRVSNLPMSWFQLTEGGVGKLEPFGATKLVLGSPFGSFGRSYKTDTKMVRNINFLVEN